MLKARSALHIRLEGSLEAVETLTERWRAATAELSVRAMPAESTLRALRAGETEGREAIADTERVADARTHSEALRRAREQWAEGLRARLAELGVPAPAAASPTQLIDHVLELGEFQVLNLVVQGVRPPGPKEPSLPFLWLGCATIAGFIASVPELSFANVLLGGWLVSYSLVRFLRWASHKPVRPVLHSRALYVRHAAPIELSTLECVREPGAVLNPTDLEFQLKDGRVIPLSLSPNAEPLLERLRALGVRVEAPGR